MVWHNAIERGVMVLLMSSEMKKKTSKTNAQGRRCSGAVEVSPHKKR